MNAWASPWSPFNIAIENGPVEIVDFPIKNGDFPLFCVCLPEGTIQIADSALSGSYSYV